MIDVVVLIASLVKIINSASVEPEASVTTGDRIGSVDHVEVLLVDGQRCRRVELGSGCEGPRVDSVGEVEHGGDCGWVSAEVAVLYDVVGRISEVGAPVDGWGSADGALDELVGEGGRGDHVELVHHCEEGARSSVGDPVVGDNVDAGVGDRVGEGSSACADNALAGCCEGLELVVVELYVLGKHSWCFLHQ